VRLPGFRRHPVSEEELSAYLDGRLPTAAQERVDAHLKACTDCSRKLEETLSLVAELRRLPRAKAPRSFAISPELAAATRREADRARQDERATARRAYLGLSGATAAAAVLLIAVLGVELAPSLGGNGGPASTTTSSREAVGVTAPQDSGEADKALSGGEPENVAPGVAPPLPSAVVESDNSSANATPAVATPYDAAAAAPQQAQPVAKESSHLLLWIVEGAAGGLIVGFGASAFWMRRRWIQINRS
jgi:hypothetical protein